MLKFVSFDIVFQEIPQQVTLAINISNCPNHCEGCHSPHLWEDIGHPLDTEAIDRLLEEYGSSITCFCFMGGDAAPFEVARLAAYLRSLPHPVLTAWYSGRQELPQDFPVNHFNYIKLGPYLSHLGGLRSPHTNQQLYRVENGALVPIRIANPLV